MYPAHQSAMMAPPPTQSRAVAAETFLLDQDAQQSLPADSVVALQQVDNLKYFLISAPVDWSPDQYIRRFLLPTGEYVSCVLWNNLYHISGTDIVRCLAFRFQAFGRPVKNTKKFEEGIFSDLRNLKSGTDASLEEPKSPFLDFLYKNNCIRTQKKQKVFYWYSVPHDRLFLDALERDLKREKSGQEATTTAVSEPALSFEFDSSQSLFEQLTKAQQGSSFPAPQPSSMPSSHAASPVMRAADSMPPPSAIPQQQISEFSQNSMPAMPDDAMIQQPTFSQMAMMPMPPMPSQIQRTREQSANPVFDRNGVPLSQVAQRHSSMPSYMEYSPAPSFVSSHYEDYSQRGLSFEPITPPQNSHSVGSEPAYIANEDTGLYTAIPDSGLQSSFNPLLSFPPNFSTAQYSAMNRAYPSQPSFPALDGSPTYKQRRRRSSLTPGVVASVISSSGPVAAHAVHRPSDLRRSVSYSVVPQTISEDVETHAYTESPASTSQPIPYISRHGTPTSMGDGSFVDDRAYARPVTVTHDFAGYDSSPSHDYRGAQLQHQAIQRTVSGPFRRARSATVSELGPYPQKSHSCPIPSCGRLFKRLEHLKRHVRTHTQERPYLCDLCNKAFSRSDNLAQHRRIHETSVDGIAPGEEEMDDETEPLHPKPEVSETAYHPVGMVSGNANMMNSNGAHSMSTMGPPPQMIHTGDF